MFFKEKSDGCQPKDTTTEDGEARNDFWTIAGDYIYRRHVEPRVKLCVPCDMLMLSGGQLQHWMCCWKGVLTIIGTLMVAGIYRRPGPVSRSSQHELQNLQTETRRLGGG